MDKHIYDKRNGLWYELQGDDYIPCLELPAEKEERHIGVWGSGTGLSTHRKALYTSLLTSGKLNSYLADIDRQAEEMFSRLVKQLSEKEGVTETLKAENQMLWVQKMNNLRNAVMEIVSNELICC
ncbi:MAG: TnpV protein [Christensenellales bacterium]